MFELFSVYGAEQRKQNQKYEGELNNRETARKMGSKKKPFTGV